VQLGVKRPNWEQVGDAKQREANFGTGERVLKERRLSELGLPFYLSLNMTCGAGHEQHVYPNHTTSLPCSSLVSLTDDGPHKDRRPILFFSSELFCCWFGSSTESTRKWKIIQTVTKNYK
jgi:hypothetical protein